MKNKKVKYPGKILFQAKKRLVILGPKSIYMKKMNSRFYGILLILIIFSGACSNKEVIPSATKTELITRSAWKFKLATAAGLGDVSSNIPACYKDNLNTFMSNLTGSVSEGVVFCSPTTAGPFTWSFQSNETLLFISTVLFPGGSQTFNLVSVSETELVISQTVSPPLSVPLLITFTFIH